MTNLAVRLRECERRLEIFYKMLRALKDRVRVLEDKVRQLGG